MSVLNSLRKFSEGSEAPLLPAFLIPDSLFPIRGALSWDPAKLQEVLWMESCRMSRCWGWNSTDSQARPIFRTPFILAPGDLARSLGLMVGGLLWITGSWCTQGLFEPSESLWWVSVWF